MTAAFAVAAATFVFVVALVTVARDARRLVTARRRRTSAHVRRLRRSLSSALDGVRSHRQRAVADRVLPDVLEGLARALRGGASLTRALAECVPDHPPLLAAEWRALASQAADRGVGYASSAWRRSRPTTSVRLAASALVLAAKIGGPQARAVDAMATTLRQRLALAAELRALSSQARASAALIGAAPLAFAAVGATLEPRYAGFVFGTPVGFGMLGAGLALNAAGLVWMQRITASVR